MASEEYKESDLSKIVKRLMDEEGFEFGEAVKEAMEQTKKFESKADGGSIGIEVLFQPKREKFNTGGIGVGGSTSLASLQRQGYQLQNTPTKRSYDSRATTQDYTNALKNVSAGTTYQQQADSKRYARQEANRMLTDAFRSGNQQGLQNLYNQFGFNATAPGSQLFSRGTTSGTLNQITGLSAANRDRVLDQMAQRMLSYPTGGSSAPPKKSPLQLKIEENQRIYNEYIKNNAPQIGLLPGSQGGAPTIPKPEYEDKALLSQLTMLTPEEAFAGETFDTLSDLDQYNFAQAFTQFQPQLRDPSYVSPYGAPDGRQIFGRRYGIKDGGRVGMLSGGALKTVGSGIMKLFGKGDDVVDLAKQEEIFRSGDITTDFLEKVDDKVIKKFITTRDTKGPGGYGMYDNFDDMPNGLKAAELISRIKTADGGINYEAAELFIGKKLKGDETVNELISMVITEKKADGGRVGLFMGGDPLTGQALSIYDSMKAYNFSDQEIANALSAQGLYTTGSTPVVEEPVTNTVENIINQGGGDGPPGPDPTGTKTYGKTFTGMTMPDGTPIGSSGVVEGPGIIDGLKNTATDLFDLYSKFSPIGIFSKFMKQRAEKQQELQDNAIDKAKKEREMQQAIKDAEAAQAALNNAVRTGRRAGSGGAGIATDDTGTSYDAGGREGFGYGLKDGGLATMFTRRR